MERIKLLAIIFWAIFFFLLLEGCSSSTEITKTEKETITIQPINIKPPKIETEFEAKLIEPIKKDSVKVYEGEKTIEVISSDGVKVNARIKSRITINKKDSIANVQIEIEQDSITTKAKVIKSETKIEEKKETISFFDEMKSFLIWLIILAAVASAGIYIFKVVIKK